MLSDEQKSGLQAGITSRAAQITQLQLENKAAQDVLDADAAGLTVAQEQIDAGVAAKVDAAVAQAKADQQAADAAAIAAALNPPAPAQPVAQ